MLNRRRPPRAVADGPIPLVPPQGREKLPRKLGEFLLTSQIDEDALGHVYRAITLGEKHEFVRLRVFDSPELPRRPLAETLRANNWYVGTLSGAAIPRGVRMGSVLGLPYLAWPEAHGWSLHALFRGLRTAGRRLSLEHSILISDRIAAALESAQKTKLDRRPLLHGLLWPGFVAIGEHGDLQVGGFGIALGILQALDGERLSAELAPYLAPEERSQRRPAVNSDLYSVGAILLELLTGRPPGAEELRPALRSEDGIPFALARVLRVCFAPAELRFPSPSSFRRELAKVVVGSGLDVSSYRLAGDLRTLCNPGLPASDGTPERPLREAPTDAEIDRTLDDLWERLRV